MNKLVGSCCALAALAILQFLGHWDSLLWPLVVMTKEIMYTLPVGLAMFSGDAFQMLSLRNAGSFVANFPVVIIFLLFQRSIMKGIALTGLKA